MLSNAPPNTLSLLHVDPHQTSRVGLQAFIAQQSGYQLENVATVLQAKSVCVPNKYEIVLIEPAGALEDFIEFVESIRNGCPSTKVVMFTAKANPELISHASQAGAAGYISKADSLEKLLDSLKRVATDGNCWEMPIKPTPPRLVPVRSEKTILLTQREQRILTQVAAGAENDEIAQHLGVSLKTVKNDLQRIQIKANTSNRTESALWGVHFGYIGQ